MHGRELKNSGRRGVQEQSQHACRWEKGQRQSCVWCRVPMRAASRQVKDAFFSRRKVHVLGDFNAHVGSRECVGDWWGSVRGPHGYEVINNTGKELSLFFLSIVPLCVTRGSHTKPCTNRHGSTRTPKSGVVLTMSS